MYTLIGSPMSRAIRVIWCLEELGVDYEIIPAAPGSADAKKHNPSGKIPALIVDGVAIIDSIAICQFLADKHDALTYPAGSIERAQMDSFIHFAADEVDHACWVWAKHDWIYPEPLKAENVKPACEHEFNKAMKHLEERLGDNKYVMGDKFTVPDIILGQCSGWATSMCKFQIPDGKVADYFKRVTSRPAFRRAIKTRKV